MSLKNIYKWIRKRLRPVKVFYRNLQALFEAIRLWLFMAQSSGKNRIFYLGRTENNNLGDNGQYYCILNWIKENYPEYKLHLTAAYYITAKWRIWLKVFKRFFNNIDDFIIFQSGYCTQDLGGTHPLMHELICEHLKDARILMMPQTIYFTHEENRIRTSKNHDGAKNMLFLARDSVSYENAQQMFPHIRVCLFPDIVTTLIGKYDFEKNRDKIFLCCRNDGEKLYSEEEINLLRTKLSTIAPVDFGDTQSKLTGAKLRKKIENNIESEIERLSQYKVVITDRYHGTIFSLCANTPVIIIKTKDHKVTTGAEWFKGVYDNHVFVAKDLDEAFWLASKICSKFNYIRLEPYFDEKYYSNLKKLFAV